MILGVFQTIIFVAIWFWSYFWDKLEWITSGPLFLGLVAPKYEQCIWTDILGSIFQIHEKGSKITTNLKKLSSKNSEIEFKNSEWQVCIILCNAQCSSCFSCGKFFQIRFQTNTSVGCKCCRFLAEFVALEILKKYFWNRIRLFHFFEK